MKIKPNGETEEVEAAAEDTNELPGGDGASQPAVDETPADDAARIRELEIEAARLKGANEVLSKTPVQPLATQPNQLANYKQVVWGDVNSLSDEEFETKHKMPKYKATSAILEAEADQQKQELSETRAEARLAAKYGKDFYEVKGEVDEMLKDVSPEVRRDPERLAKFMEKAVVAAIKSKPEPIAPAKAATPVNRSKITGGFDKPSAAPAAKPKEPVTDEIEQSLRPIGRAFGLSSEKERKELMANDYIEMDLGGVVFRDPNRGFEKVKAS